VVTRLEKRGDRFVEEPYEGYAPRVLAGIAGLKDTLEDRALTLVMLRRRRGEVVARIGRPTEGEAQGPARSVRARVPVEDRRHRLGLRPRARPGGIMRRPLDRRS